MSCCCFFSHFWRCPFPVNLFCFILFVVLAPGPGFRAGFEPNLKMQHKSTEEKRWRKMRLLERRREKNWRKSTTVPGDEITLDQLDKVRLTEITWAEIRQAEMTWEELRISEINWEALGRAEKRRDDVKGDGMRWDDVKRWEDTTWDEMKLDEMRWAERWKEKRLDQIKWDEPRWDEVRWSQVSRRHEIRWNDRDSKLEKRLWHWNEKSRDCCCMLLQSTEGLAAPYRDSVGVDL